MSTPLKAIRKKCLDCAGGQTEVRKCAEENCDLHPFRMGKGVKGKGSIRKPIRRYCLWCCLGRSNEAKLCPSTGCPLYGYRSGRREKSVTTPKQLAALAKARSVRASATSTSARRTASEG